MHDSRALFTADSFENPEISAMEGICKLLEALPDEVSRMRVMRWSFGRFSEEFKRPVPEAASRPDHVPFVPNTSAIPKTPVAAKPASSTHDDLRTFAAPPSDNAAAEIKNQVSELQDLFDLSTDRSNDHSLVQF
jgi:hypothetical protein